jgi:crotonyl-CoA carboxylase/reductase
MTTANNLYEIGDMPPIGAVPERMYAQTLRQANYGEPIKAFTREVVDVPPIGPDDALVYVMAAGVNYNNVWAALGRPVDVVRLHKRSKNAGDEAGFHIGGSDASGIVYAVGENVTNVKAGDEVVLHCGRWDPKEPFVADGGDPALSNSFGIWGFDTNYGSFAQFTRVQAHQCLPKPPNLTWEESCAYMLVAATAYRMLNTWQPHVVQEGDVVLVWGGSGGLGSMGVQVAKALGGIPIAVVSSDERGEWCKQIGARGYVNRRNFSHWGRLPDWQDEETMTKTLLGFRDFGRAMWDALGERRNPRIVFEHPGQDTIPTSIFTCETGGMVVICAGTTGYNGDVDLRYLWTRQKRFQGSHFANDDECRAANQMVIDGRIDPYLSQTFAFDETGLSHQLMYENRHPSGNMAILVGAPTTGLKSFNS